MRFVDFLRVTVLLSAGAASALAALTVLRAAQSEDPLEVLVVCAIWWTAAGAYGVWQGRGARGSQAAAEPIGRLLADARHQPQLPELNPPATLLNRLWPLLLVTLAAGGLAVVLPQVGAVAAGFAIIWALALRRQDGAVAAVEERDACRFYVAKTGPVEAIRLVRTPGFGSDKPVPRAVTQ